MIARIRKAVFPILATLFVAGCAGHVTEQGERGPITASSQKTSPSEVASTRTLTRVEKVPVEQRTYVFKKAGDLDICAEVFFNPQSPTPRRIIVSLHGGALMGGWRMTKLDRMSEIFVEAGYAVVSPEYRLAPETKLPEIIADVRDAHEWVCREGPALFGADPARIATLGYSAGGYLALVSAYTVKPRPRAIVSFYGYGDILGKWYMEPDAHYLSLPDAPITEEHARSVVGVVPVTSPPEGMVFKRIKFYEYCRQQGVWPREVMGLDPRTNEAAFIPYLPVRNVTREFPPTILVHGQKDTDVPYEQSAQMAEALSRAGVDHELALYPQEFHAFDGFWPADLVRKDAEDAFSRAFNFVERQMREER